MELAKSQYRAKEQRSRSRHCRVDGASPRGVRAVVASMYGTWRSSNEIDGNVVTARLGSNYI